MKKATVALALAAGMAVTGAQAVVLDLTTVPSSGTINGAIFTTPPYEVSGTGLIDPFLRIQATGTESGYNNDLATGDLEFDEKPGIWTHSLQVGDLATNVVNISGTDYYEFVLDVNETTPSSLIDVTEVEIYLDSVSTNICGSSGCGDGTGSLGTLVYDLDAGGDNSVLLNYINFPGSGKLDMYMLIPVSVIGTNADDYLYLFSAFNESTSDGFEEWARKLEGTFTVIPVPAAAWLFGSGLLGLIGIARRKAKV